MTESTPEGTTDPGPADPDAADWTWVLSRACPHCGFDAEAQPVEDVPDALRDSGPRYAARLGRPDALTRPSAGVWSPLEYACHARDAADVMRGRLEQILDGGGSAVTFANWDQDAAAVDGQYWRADAATVAEQATASLDEAAAVYARPSDEQWEWPALRSNGSHFTTRTLALYFLHDIRHHLWDVTA